MKTGASAADANSPWTQCLLSSDLSLAQQHTPMERSQSDALPQGLPWSARSGDAIWPLSEEQLRLLSFETLLLNRPLPAPDAIHSPSTPAVLLRGASAERRHHLAKQLSMGVINGLMQLEDEHEEAVLPALLQPPPRTQHGDGLAPTAMLASRGSEGAPRGTSGSVNDEEPLEVRLTRSASELGPAATDAVGLSQLWLEEQAAHITHSAHSFAHNIGLWSGPPPPPPWARSGSGRRRVRGARPKLDDTLLEEVRLQLGVRRDTAVRLARLLLLPPPTASDIASGSMLPPTLEERALYADIQPYVPYRLMLLQHLSPSHFASTSEYAAFAERQLAAFSCGLLAAVHSAPFNHRWQVPIFDGETTCDTSRDGLSAAEVEALLLLLTREQLMPLLTPEAIRDAYDPEAVEHALRRLGTLAYALLSGLVVAKVPCPNGTHSPMQLPYLHPVGLALYQPLVGCTYGEVSAATSLAPRTDAGAAHASDGDLSRISGPTSRSGLLSLEAAVALEARLLALRKAAVPVSEHTHLLCCLQRGFGRWMQSMAAPGAGAHSVSTEDMRLRLARALRATARQLHVHLREKARRAGRGEAGWSAAEIADHAAVLPSLLRFLHGLMVDYHTAFHLGGVDVTLGVLKEVVGAYFELHAIAVSFAVPARLSVTSCLRTPAEIRSMKAKAVGEAEQAADRAAALRRKIEEMEGRVDADAAVVDADAMTSHDHGWIFQQPDLAALLVGAKLLQAAAAPAVALAMASAKDGASVGGGAAAAHGDFPSRGRSSDYLVDAAAAASADETPQSEPPPLPDAMDRNAPSRSASSIYLQPTAEEAMAPAVATEPPAAGAPAAVDVNSSLLQQGGEALTRAQSDFLNREGHSANTNESDFGRALRCFEAAYTLHPRPTVLLSAANMASKLGRCSLALELYNRVLAKAASLKPEHAKLATKRAAEAAEMRESFRALLVGLREELRAADEEAEQKAAIAAADPADLDALTDQATNGGIWRPLSDESLRGVQRDLALSVVVASSECRCAGLLSSFEAPLEPSSLAEVCRLTIEDLMLEESYFGKAFDRYANAESSTYLAALEVRTRLLMEAAAPLLLRLKMAGGGEMSPRDAGTSLSAFEEWSAVWPLLGSLDGKLAAASLPALTLRGELLNVAGLMAPLITQWILHLTVRFDDELELAWERETWQALELGEGGGVASGPAGARLLDEQPASGYAAIMWDLMKLFMSTLEIFFGEFEREAYAAGSCPAPLREEWINELAFKIFLSLNKFLNRMRQRLGSWQELLPEHSTPDDLETNERRMISDGQRMVLEATRFVGATVTEIRDRYDGTHGVSEDAGAADRAEMRALCVQLNSLHFCRQELRVLAAYIDQQWVRLHALTTRASTTVALDSTSVSHVVVDAKSQLATILHNEAVGAVDAAIDEVCRFVGARIIFAHLRQPILEELYCRAAPTAEIAPMLHGASTRRGGRKTFYLRELLDETLISLFDLLPHEPIRQCVILSIMTALVRSIESVLLDGTSKRHFVEQDAPRLRADVHLLREYFIARDETGVPHGLPETVVHNATSYLDGLVTLMHSTTEQLLAMLMVTSRATPNGRSEAEMDEYDAEQPLHKCNIVRLLVLRARADGEEGASRFIETHRDDLREMLLREKAQLKETRHGQGVTELRETRERELHQELREERKRLRGGSHDAEDEDATAGDDADLPSDSHNSANTKTDKAAGVAPAAVKKAISEIFAARNKAKQHKAESVPGGREVKL